MPGRVRDGRAEPHPEGDADVAVYPWEVEVRPGAGPPGALGGVVASMSIEAGRLRVRVGGWVGEADSPAGPSPARRRTASCAGPTPWDADRGLRCRHGRRRRPFTRAAHRDGGGGAGVSVDTLRRWEGEGRVTFERRGGHATSTPRRSPGSCASAARARHSSARNRFEGVVLSVTRDKVMAQVELACGPYRVVSLMSREAADELG